jgi:nucleoside-diphosphate-sugar epimerase
MKVFVAGGTGAVGKRLVPQLVAAGHEVVATTRSSKGTETLRALGAEPVIADGLDESSMTEAVDAAQPEVVIHEMTALGGQSDLRHFDRWFATTNELRTRGTDYLIRAAQRVGARRLIAQSYTGWNNIREGGAIKDESDPLDPDPVKEMRESLAAIRHVEQVVPAADGLEGVVLRYGSLYGPGTSVTTEFPELLRKRRFPIVGDGGGVWSFIHVDDAAAATVAALDRGAPGIYNVVDDDPAPAREWMPFLAEQVGAKPPWRVPTWLGRIAAGAVAVSWMTRIRGSSNAKARRELGWEPRYPSWREGFATPGARPPGTPRPS